MPRTPRLDLLIPPLLALAACGGDAATSASAPATAAAASSGNGPAAAASAPVSAPASASSISALAGLGAGFAVWESNRSGAWRIWLRHFDEQAALPLSRDERRRAHCCPHVAPDGGSVLYLSLPRGGERYPEGGAVGELRLVATDGSGERTVAQRASTYFEHRAAVWHGPDRIVHLDGEGATRFLDLASGASRRLLPAAADPARGWLLDPTLRHATTGSPGFAAFDADTGRLIAGVPLAGCQPYFSHDGRFGFWIAGAGGPIRRIDLATGETAIVLGKSDRRLPADRGYLYFPMVSPDSRLLAWAASDGAHDHQRSDYDVFVAALDPATFELEGPPLRVTDDPATDRFPDVFLAPLALGRHDGEAPLTVDLEAPAAGLWQWQLGDGGEAEGHRVRHTYPRAGAFRVRATLDGRMAEGTVTVRPSRPPRLVRSEVAGGRMVTLMFDEPISAEGTGLTFDSGRPIAGRRLSDDGRRLVIELATELEDEDVLRVTGLGDRARPPNRTEPLEIAVAGSAWPARQDGLVLLWQTAAAANRVTVPASLGARRTVFEAHGRAATDRAGAMALAGGQFLADMPTMEGLLAGLRATNALTLELTITPASEPASGIGRIFTFSGGAGRRNLSLSQRRDELVLQVNTPETGRNAEPGLTLGAVPPGRPSHVVIGYEPGRVIYIRDGVLEREVAVATGGFFHWRPLPLLVGNEWQAEAPWHGTVEGLAVYDRVLGVDEAAENARRLARLRAARPTVERLVVRALLLARSEVPTLDAIAPYRDALAVFSYRVLAVEDGRYQENEIRVAHRVWWGGERTAAADRAVGERVDLELEPFADHPEVASLFRSETLPPRYELPLFFAPAS